MRKSPELEQSDAQFLFLFFYSSLAVTSVRATIVSRFGPFGFHNIFSRDSVFRSNFAVKIMLIRRKSALNS